MVIGDKRPRLRLGTFIPLILKAHLLKSTFKLIIWCYYCPCDTYATRGTVSSAPSVSCPLIVSSALSPFPPSVRYRCRHQVSIRAIYVIMLRQHPRLHKDFTPVQIELTKNMKEDKLQLHLRVHKLLYQGQPTS